MAFQLLCPSVGTFFQDKFTWHPNFYVFDAIQRSFIFFSILLCSQVLMSCKNFSLRFSFLWAFYFVVICFYCLADLIT